MKSKWLFALLICLFAAWAQPVSLGEKVSLLELDQISAQTNDEEAGEGEVEKVGGTAERQEDSRNLKAIQDQMGALARALAKMPDPPDMNSQILVPLVTLKEKETKQERG